MSIFSLLKKFCNLSIGVTDETELDLCTAFELSAPPAGYSDLVAFIYVKFLFVQKSAIEPRNPVFTT